ncbi:hypothetical protein LTR17_013336 [Elasticomyces elasticus]|nr:hypothetical protein LTR17_013336 [Elasticomyces elasticus]
MHSHTLIPAALLAFSTTILAQDPGQSAPFQLKLKAEDCPTYDGVYLYACHEGAAIEGLCTGNTTADVEAWNTFGLNYTTSGVPIDPKVGQQGILTWVLEYATGNLSSAMSLYADPATNVGIPLFEPSYGSTPVSFDEDNVMNIPSYLDDTVEPPAARETPIGLRRWYVCQNYYSGYSYVKSLSWVYGEGEPQNPSCEKVDVVRVFL